MFKCKQCQLLKPVSCFKKDTNTRRGHRSSCKECINKTINSKEYNQQYYQKNKDRLKLKHRLYRQRNLSLCRAMTRASQKKNPAVSAAHSAKRRAIKSMCTPKWLTPTHIEQINMFYECSAFYSNLTGTKFQVDHIIPMQGKEVCGLHVPWNLQVITREENISKRNFLDLNK